MTEPTRAPALSPRRIAGHPPSWSPSTPAPHVPPGPPGSRPGAGGDLAGTGAGGVPPERIDFHSHTFLTDGDCAATDMWAHALLLGHRALAITDHLYGEDPRPMLEILLAEQEMAEGSGIETLVGVEISMNPPRRIASAAKAARKAGAQIVIVHGETPVEPVPPGTNRAAIESNEVDVLAHPGLLTEEDAALAKEHGVALELTPRRGHSWGNGVVAMRALTAGAELVVDSDAHNPDQLLRQESARKVALGAGLSMTQVERALRGAPERLLQRLKKA